MSWAGNVWDNSAMESFFSSLKTERTARKVYRTATKPVPTCTITSSASITREDGTLNWTISAPWSSRPALC